MNYSSTGFRMGPDMTPSIIKKIIIATCSLSLFVALVNNIFTYLFNIPGPMEWLSLSWWGMKNYFFWQPVSYLFVHNVVGINMSFLLTLFFNMYILWIFGTEVLNRVGKNSFVRFYFVSGILAGLITFLLMPVTGQYGTIAGATPSVIALMIVWTLLNPNTIIFLFFIIPIKAKWLTMGLIGSILLISLSNLDLIQFCLYFFAATIGYLYGVAAWGLHSPFDKLYPLEVSLIQFSQRLRSRFFGFLPKKMRNTTQPKNVFDINTGNPVQDDDAFIDAMLEKISRYGENSLTWSEKKRMDEISVKRKGMQK